MEILAGNGPTPDAILMALEETINSDTAAIEEVIDDKLVNYLLKNSAKQRMQRELGKWLPKNAEATMAQALDGLESSEDKMAAMCYAIQRLKEVEGWKEEQRKIRRAQRHFMKSETSKMVVNGKKQWSDAQVYELPPLVKSEGTSMQHEPARYVIRLPDATYVDLGQTQNGFTPILRDGPDKAMQSIAKRLGLDIRGGAHTILQQITGLNNIIPAYTTVWHRNQWMVIVGWQRDPKTTLSNYWLDEAGNLTRKRGLEDDQLTLSELDYHLLKEAAETAVEDESGEIVDYMNEQEELVEQGHSMTDYRQQFDMSILAEDEAALIQFLSKNMDNELSQLNQGSLGDIDCQEAIWLVENKLSAAKKWMETAMSKNDEDEMAAAKSNLAYARGLMIAQNRFSERTPDSLIRRWYPETTNQMMMMRKENCLKEPVKVIRGAALSPTNTIERATMKHADQLGEHLTVEMHRLKRGTSTLVASPRGLIRKAVPQVKAQPINAKNAPEALTKRIRKMIADELETNPYAAVQAAFAEAFEEALRA